MATKTQNFFSTLEWSQAIALAGLKQEFLYPRIEKYLATTPEDLHAGSYQKVVESCSIKFSYFFRDPEIFFWISTEIIPEIIYQPNFTIKNIRIWSAGCAEGEEAYSLAILLHQALQIEDWPQPIPAIFATDFSQNNLQNAKEGIYTRNKLINVTLGMLDKYFFPVGHRYQVQPFLKKMVHFSLDNMTSGLHHAPVDSVFGDFDLILCRNVLIYYTQEGIAAALKNLCSSLRPGGWLVLGDCESLPATFNNTHFVTAHPRYNIFRKVA